MEWIPTADRMPVSGTPVLADTGRKHPIRACWVAKFSEEVGASDFDGDEDYDEKTDTSYWPEGWYEWNRYEDTHWRVDETVTHWMPLPLPFNAGLSAGRGRDAAAKVALVGDAAIAALRDLDARLRECMALGLSAAEAYDSGYQEATAAALAVVAA